MKKLLIFVTFLLLSAQYSLAQTPARTFTYDAAGNRIAMGVPTYTYYGGKNPISLWQ